MGKRKVAMAPPFQSYSRSKQAAFLVPTTILAQHITKALKTTI